MNCKPISTGITTFMVFLVCYGVGAYSQLQSRAQNEYEWILEMLASKNPAPKFDKGGKAIDANFNEAEIARVAGLLEKVAPRNDREWRTLLDYLKDKRYCISGYRQHPSSMRNFEIGELCTEVARAQVSRQVAPIYESLKLDFRRGPLAVPIEASLVESRNAFIDHEVSLLESRSWHLPGKYEQKLSKETAMQLIEKLKSVRKSDAAYLGHSFNQYSWYGESPGKREK